MSQIDRSIWILFLSGTAGTIAVYLLTGEWHAAAVTAMLSLFAIAMLFDALERRAASVLASVPPPVEGGASEDELETMLQALPHPSLIVQRGRIERCNGAALALLGRHIAGQDVRLALRHPAAIDLLSGKGAAEPAVIEIVGLGTAEQSWELVIQPLTGARQLVMLFDQSGRQATERMRVDFVANASHELRTPLAGILGFVETLRDPVAGADGATRERFLAIMEGEARRMQRLVDDLMSLSRIEAEKYRAPDQPVALPPLIDEVISIFRQNPAARGREIRVEAPLDLPVVRGDRAQLSQLLHNLVSNALKYGAAGTPVTISARATPSTMIELTVADQGDGILPQHLPRLTERFYRVDSSRSRAMGGTGLGLAIVKHIVQRHGGVLNIDSTVGVGTSVRVELPPFETSRIASGRPALATAGDAVTKLQ